jgi:hypothetical protein
MKSIFACIESKMTLLIVIGIFSLLPHSYGQEEEDINLSINPRFEKYILTYDVGNSELSCFKYSRCYQNGQYKAIKGGILRLKINTMIEVQFTNYNALNITPALNYEFDNLNIDGSEELFAALLRTPQKESGVTNEVAKEDTSGTSEGSEKSFTEFTGDDPIEFEVLKTEIGDINNCLREVEVTLLNDYDFKESNIFKEVNFENRTLKQSFFEMDENGMRKFIKTAVNPATSDTQRKELLDSCQKAAGVYMLLLQYKIASELLAFKKELEALLAEMQAEPITPDKNKLKLEIKKKNEEWSALYRILNLENKKASDAVIELKQNLIYAGWSKDDKLKPLLDAAKRIDEIYEKLTTYTQYSFAPIQMEDSDVLKLHFMLGDKKLNEKPYKFYGKGGWKIDFSGGVVVSFLDTREYYYSDIRRDTVVTGTTVTNGDTTLTTREDVYGRIEEQRTSPNWSLGLMAHFYPRTGWIFNPSITLGAQVREDQVALLLGGSILLGRSQRLALSGGFSLGNALRLKPGYEVGDEALDNGAEKSGDVEYTEQRMSHSFFVGFTYNLGGVR